MSEYFSGNPIRLDISRSKYHVSPRWTGSWNVGKCVPIFATSSVLPGDTFKMRISSAVRTTTPVAPIMDDMDMTIECYFVPHHLIMSRQYMSPSVNDSNTSWAAFIGAQDSLLNMPLPGDVELPTVDVAGSEYDSTDYRFKVGGLVDCLGLPDVSGEHFYTINFLKLGAYYSIWNEYWRDPNTMSPVTYRVSGGRALFTGLDAGIPISDVADVGQNDLAPTCRYHGYFGSALPWPQRNSTSVLLPLGDSAPIKAGSTVNALGGSLQFGVGSNIAEDVTDALSLYIQSGNKDGVVFKSSLEADGSPSANPIVRSNLYADLSAATAASINQFRLAVQTQRWYEQLARSGNREGEITYGMFGVRGNDEGLKRPEYLGGKRIPIIQTQVAATGNATNSTASQVGLGGTGAFSLTNDSDYYFTKSFTTWGTLMVVMTCRTRESFSQGLDKEDFRSTRFDYYWPQFANLGEEPIRQKQIFVSGVSSDDDAVFGYQEAWADYRMFNDKVTGLVRPKRSLGYMTYANNFAAAPTLKSYLNAGGQQSNVDRTLQVSSVTSGLTFYGQFQFDIDMVRPMPLYSIPGLVDHH